MVRKMIGNAILVKNFILRIVRVICRLFSISMLILLEIFI